MVTALNISFILCLKSIHSPVKLINFAVSVDDELSTANNIKLHVDTSNLNMLISYVHLYRRAKILEAATRKPLNSEVHSLLFGHIAPTYVRAHLWYH